jgi:phage shock protein PspC (stress-responsive transcriptional regulator)
MVDQFVLSVKLSIFFSGIFLWVGMITGVWKYFQISRSVQARAHYYVDIAHRSSLLYAPATLIVGVLAYFSAWSESVNLLFVLINIFFFAFSILVYICHGFLQDTTNQFKEPHKIGHFTIHKVLMRVAMILLVIGEVGATMGLLIGVYINLF